MKSCVIFPLVDSLTQKKNRRSDSIHTLAANLAISVNKLKRLYEWGVFPDPHVEKTPGGHWRVLNPDIPELRTRLLLWNFWHRKGLCRLKADYKQSLTHSHARQEELEKLHFALIQTLDMGFILTVQDSERWTREIVKASRRMKHKDHQEALPPRGRVINLKDLNPEQLAVALLQVNVKELSQRRGGKAITVKTLATHMGIGVSTLYRVYGKDRLRAALLSDVKVITKKEECDQAKSAKNSKQFRYRNIDEGAFFDEETAQLSEDSCHACRVSIPARQR